MFDDAGDSGRYDAEHERQMRQMKATLHSQAVSLIYLFMIKILLKYTIKCMNGYTLKTQYKMQPA